MTDRPDMSEQPTPKAMTVETHEMIVARLERDLEEARKQIEASDWAQRQLTTSLEEARRTIETRTDLLNEERLAKIDAEAAAEEARQALKESLESEASLAREVDEARQEVERVRRMWEETAKAARIQTLEAALREAPHSMDCEAGNTTFVDPQPCTCYKAALQIAGEDV